MISKVKLFKVFQIKTKLPQWQNDFDGSDIILNEDLPVVCNEEIF